MSINEPGLGEPLSAEELDRSRRRVRRHTRGRRRKAARRIVAVLAVVAALCALVADGSPTGFVVVDGAYRALFAAGVTVLASRARRWTLFVAAGAAGAAGSEGIPLALAISALATGFGSLWFGRRQREFGAVIGALTAQAFLWLPTDLPTLVPTLVAAIGLLPLVVSGLANTRDPRRTRWTVGLTMLVLAAIGAAFTIGMFQIQEDGRSGIASALEGLEAAENGNDAASTAAFAEADRHLGSAATTASAWWLAPARVIPILSPHVEAAIEVADHGSELATLSTEAAATLDVRGLSDAEGSLDLQRIAALTPQAVDVADALESAGRAVADLDSPWLLPPVADRVDQFRDEIDRVAPAARNAADGLRLAPQLLGADRPTTYLVLVENPAEARELGGFVASAGLLIADRGSLEFDSFGSVTSLNRVMVDDGLTLEDLGDDLPPPLTTSSPERFLQNWTNSADFEAVAGLSQAGAPTLAGRPVDGVLVIDPYVVAELLEITGPVRIEGRDKPLRGNQAVDYLLREQYATGLFESDGERKEQLREAAELAFDELTSNTVPDPRQLANRLAPLVQARRLLFSTVADEPQELLRRVGLTPTLDQGSTDMVHIAQENLRANKLDAYLERDIGYSVQVDADGNATAAMTVEITNTAPEVGLDPYVSGDGGRVRENPLPDGLARINLDVYSRLRADRASIDGEMVGYGAVSIERLHRTSVLVDIPAGSTVTVVVEFSGTLAGDYALDLVPTATAAPDTVSVTGTVAGREIERRAGPLTMRTPVEP